MFTNVRATYTILKVLTSLFFLAINLSLSNVTVTMYDMGVEHFFSLYILVSYWVEKIMFANVATTYTI
jgi:hypothetical protein